MGEQIGSDVRSLDDLAPGMELAGRVEQAPEFGAFVDVGVGCMGLIHVSDMPGGKMALRAGDEVRVWVLKVEPARRLLALSMVPPRLQDAHQDRVNQERERAAYRKALGGIGLVRKQLAHEVTALLRCLCRIALAEGRLNTLEGKQEFAKRVNGQMRTLGMAIRHPDDGMPCVLYASNDGKTGRFVIEKSATKERSHTTTLERFPELIAKLQALPLPLDEDAAPVILPEVGN